MSHPAFILENGNLTYDPSYPNLCTDEPVICYGVKVPAPRPAPPYGGGSLGGDGYVPELGLKKKYINVSGYGVGSKFLEKATQVVKNLKDKSVPTSPLEAAVKEISQEKIQQGMIRILRKRITDLEAHIRQLKSSQVAERVLIEEELEKVQMIAVVLLKQLEATQSQLSELARRVDPIVINVTVPEAPPRASGWKILGYAAATWLVSEYVLPPKPEWIRAFGERLSFALASVGACRIVKDL